MVNELEVVVMETKTHVDTDRQDEVHDAEKPGSSCPADLAIEDATQREINDESNRLVCTPETRKLNCIEILPGQASITTSNKEDVPLRERSLVHRVEKQIFLKQTSMDGSFEEVVSPKLAALDEGLDDEVPHMQSSLGLEIPIEHTLLDGGSLKDEVSLKQTSLVDAEVILKQESHDDDEVLLRQTSLVDDEVLLRQTSLVDDEVLLRQTSLVDDEVLLRQTSQEEEEVLLRQTSLVDDEVLLVQTSQVDDEVLLRQTSLVDDAVLLRQTSLIDDKVPHKQTSLENDFASQDIEPNKIDAQDEHGNETVTMGRQSPSKHFQDDDIISLDSRIYKDVPLSPDGDCLEDGQTHTGIQPQRREKTQELTMSPDDCDQYQEKETPTDRVLSGKVRPDCGCRGTCEGRQVKAKLKEEYTHTELDIDELQWKGTQETEVTSVQSGDEKTEDEALSDGSLAGEVNLKMQNEALQARLKTLTHENNEKSIRITSLEGDLLEMTSKLKPRDTQKHKYEAMETCPNQQDRPRSRNCAIL